MAQAHSDALAAQLAAASDEAAKIREVARALPPTEADLAQMVPSARLVDLFLTDLSESLRQVFVAGLSFPDPELPEALRELLERAKMFQFASAVEGLGKLRAWLQATLAEPDLEARQKLAAGAWSETQRLVAWMRLYKAEHDLLTVQARMAAEAQGVKVEAAQSFKTRSLTAWPVGVELASSGKFLVIAVDTETRQQIVLADHLAEFNAQNPFDGRAISRLFQDGIELPVVLRSLVRLDEHPVVERGDVAVFRPAFRAIPRLLPVADNFKPPPLPALRVVAGAEVPRGPSMLEAHVAWSSGRLHVGPRLGDLPLRVSPLLRFNLAKLLVREASRGVDLDLCVLPHDDEFDVLHAVTDLDGRTFPAHDPALFRIDAQALQARAERVHIPGETVAELFLKTTTYALGRGKADAIVKLREATDKARPHGIEEHYRLAFARALLGAPLEPKSIKPLLDDVFALLLRSPGVAVDLEALARVLGRKPGEVSASDTRLLDGAVAYRALWLAMQAEMIPSLRPLLLALYEAHFEGELKSASPGDVCTRALLLAMLATESASGTAVEGGMVDDEEDEEDEEDEDDEDDGEALVLARKSEGWKKAQEFLQAHLDDFAPRRATTKSKPLPEAIELLQLADTRAFLHGEDRLGATLLPLNLPGEKLRARSIEGLLNWCLGAGDRPSWKVAIEAADGLLVAAAAGQAAFLVG